MAYSSTIDDFDPKTDDVDDVVANDVNELQTAIENIEAALGTDIEGDETDLAARLAHTINDAGMLEFDAATELTIASGAITVTQNYHTIDTESDDASDDLDSISGGTDGMMVVFRLAAAARDVVIKHDVDNIYCQTGADITLAEAYQTATAIYDGTLTRWLVR